MAGAVALNMDLALEGYQVPLWDYFSNELHRLSDQLRALDLIDTNRSSWSAGSSARSLLPGATLLADLV